MPLEELKHKAARLAEKHSEDISSYDLVLEMNDIIMVHNANFGRKQLSALELLNSLAVFRFESIFPNLSVSLRMYLTAPTTATSAERYFSSLKLIKDYLRSTMDQGCLNNLARLIIESDIARRRRSHSNSLFLPRKRHPRQPCFNEITLFTKISIIYILFVDCCLHETVSIQVI